jgi:DNA-binding PadR family transcriptional regulator
MRLIKNRYRLNCLIALNDFGATYTYCVKNAVKQKVKSEVKTSHILQNLKQLEKDGYVKGERSGSGCFWVLTKSGREFVAKIKG